MSMFRTAAITASIFAAGAAIAAPTPTNPRFPMLLIDHQEVQNGPLVPMILVDVRNQSVLRFQLVGLSCRATRGGKTAAVADGLVQNIGPGETASGQILFINPDAAKDADAVECRVTSAI